MSSVYRKILAESLKAPQPPVLGRSSHQRLLHIIASRLESLDPGGLIIAEVERSLFEADGAPPLGSILALKMARSQIEVAALPADLTLWVAFAMYAETNRLQPLSLHRHGEDLLVNKIEQLEALFAGSRAAWKMVAVDDGCPDGSGKMALEILQRSYPEHLESGRIKVLFLDEAITAGLQEATGIDDARASRKGGSLLFGLRTIHGWSKPGDILLYTDADLSTHLGQAGLLIGPLVRGEVDFMAGSRREDDSVQIKPSSRDKRGRLFISLWKQMLPVLPRIVDSQAAFKAFRADRAGSLLAQAHRIGFALDLELLLLAHLEGLEIGKTGFCWIDSAAESNTKDLEVHLRILQSVAALRRRYLPGNTPGGKVARFVESLDLQAWKDCVAEGAVEPFLCD